MKIVIIAGITAFILSVAATMFFTGTFNRNKGEAVSESTQGAEKDNKSKLDIGLSNEKHEVAQNTTKTNTEIPSTKSESTTLKTEVEKYKAQISAEEAKLSTIKSDVESTKNTKTNIAKYQQLAKLYGAMKAEDAASVLCQLDANLTEHILSGMNDRNAGKIMGAIASKDPSYAAKVSKIIVSSGSESSEF
jgi:flagellar motility protein MotE (MotC chaperone)